MNMLFDADGTVRCLHSDLLPLREIGSMTVRRASNVEFNESSQQWEVLHLRTGAIMFASAVRAECLAWEDDNWESLIDEKANH